jgi:nicotinate-nucleotide adenylyltransferase
MGGTFDPIHIAHLIIAEEVADRLGLARVVFIPAARPPHKCDRECSRFEDRMAMVKLAVEDNPRLAVSDIERRREGPSYTIETVRELKDEFEDAEELYFIIGADSLAQLLTWKDPEALLAECTFVVAPRPGVNIADADPRIRDRTLVLDMPSFEIASSDIRERVRLGRTIRYLVPPRVLAYIEEENLYT